MTAKKFEELLNELGACSSAVEWARGKTLHAVWKTCQRGDWLFWLAGKMADKKGWHTRKQIVLAACVCAETALKYVPKGEERPKKAIQTARAWARGKATIEEVRNAGYAACYAASAASAVCHAADAAYAADAGYAACSAADAASAASAASLKDSADIVRKYLKEPKA